MKNTEIELGIGDVISHLRNELIGSRKDLAERGGSSLFKVTEVELNVLIKKMREVKANWILKL